ncbi:MAG: hypothetical protein IJ728_07850 [Selenomonadaceae bacterium]|nr:hypothetical protein [Selenomonadaceae bacterium]
MQKALKETNNLNNSSVDEVKFDHSDSEEDADLIKLVEERIKKHNKNNEKTYTMEEIDKFFGITEEDLNGWEEVEI